MVAETEAMEFVTTHTEVEALLLESNLIKRLKPRYNIRLLDDKSFPYILGGGDHPFPRAVKHRGARVSITDCSFDDSGGRRGSLPHSFTSFAGPTWVAR